MDQSKINRRGFLGTVGAAATGLALAQTIATAPGYHCGFGLPCFEPGGADTHIAPHR